MREFSFLPDPAYPLTFVNTNKYGTSMTNAVHPIRPQLIRFLTLPGLFILIFDVH